MSETKDIIPTTSLGGIRDVQPINPHSQLAPGRGLNSLMGNNIPPTDKRHPSQISFLKPPLELQEKPLSESEIQASILIRYKQL